MRRWFTSDLHLGSAWAARLRRSPSVANHDAWLGARWDSVIAAHDKVYILGDLIGELDQQALDEWLLARPGEKYLVLGNNDIGFDFTALRGLEAVTNDWALVELANGMTVVMSHYPDSVAPMGLSNGLRLHGHTHRKEKITAPGVIHVGWEAWRRYVPEEDLITVLEQSLREGARQ